MKVDISTGTVNWYYKNERTISASGYQELSFMKYKEDNG